MRALYAFACVAFLFATSIPAAAYGPCQGSRCALSRSLGQLPGQILLGKCCNPVPPGWGFYLRQRLRQDETPPLIIVDELGGVTLYRDPR